MGARRNWMGIPTLALLCTACPATSPSTAAIQFACDSDVDCLPGNVCQQGRCGVAVPDASVVLVDGAGSPDRAMSDGRHVDTLATDGTIQDVVATDHHGDAAAAAERQDPDSGVSDLTGTDTGQPDSPAGDTPRADSSSSDVADASTPDAMASDAVMPDVAVVDVTIPDTAVDDIPFPDAQLSDRQLEDTPAGDAPVDDLGSVDACLPTGPESTADLNCHDGRDNDCDGWSDEHDDDCWWNQSWTRRRKLTFDNAARDTSLDDFPVLLVLTSDRLDFGHTADDGADLRFVAADDRTELAHEIEHYQEPDPALVWVKVPHIAALSSSGFIWMYYGSSAASGAQPAQVWSNGFEGVYHCAGNLDDSSANAFDGTNHGSNNLPSGHIGESRSFNGNSQWIDLGAGRDFLSATSAATLSAWVKPTSVSGDRSIIAISIYNGTTPTGVSRAYLELAEGYVAIGGRGSDSDIERRLVSDNSAITPGTWHHVVGLLDYASRWGTIYVDGMQIDAGALSFDQTSTANTTATSSAIGAQDDGTTYYFAGHLDELRVAARLRTAAWISAEYTSQMDNGFVVYGAEQVH
ncbi:MAG: DUF2341 domain-containing protein [Pseudomonadota bacterium]